MVVRGTPRLAHQCACPQHLRTAGFYCPLLWLQWSNAAAILCMSTCCSVVWSIWFKADSVAQCLLTDSLGSKSPLTIEVYRGQPVGSFLMCLFSGIAHIYYSLMSADKRLILLLQLKYEFTVTFSCTEFWVCSRCCKGNAFKRQLYTRKRLVTGLVSQADLLKI